MLRKICEVFTKEYRKETEYREFVSKMIHNKFKPGNPIPLGVGRKGSFFTKKIKNFLFFYSLLKNPAY